MAYTENGLRFSDGTEIKADVIVFATGFLGNLRQHVEELLGKEVADRAGDCFGLNEEGEILGAFKPVNRTYNLILCEALGIIRCLPFVFRTRAVVPRWRIGARKILFAIYSPLNQGSRDRHANSSLH